MEFPKGYGSLKLDLRYNGFLDKALSSYEQNIALGLLGIGVLLGFIILLQFFSLFSLFKFVKLIELLLASLIPAGIVYLLFFKPTEYKILFFENGLYYEDLALTTTLQTIGWKMYFATYAEISYANVKEKEIVLNFSNSFTGRYEQEYQVQEYFHAMRNLSLAEKQTILAFLRQKHVQINEL